MNNKQGRVSCQAYPFFVNSLGCYSPTVWGCFAFIITANKELKPGLSVLKKIPLTTFFASSIIIYLI